MYTPPPSAGGDGNAVALKTTGANVNVSSAAPPTAGQVLTADDATHASWHTPAAGSGLLKVATVTLSGADIAAIGTTPVAAVPAPGAGRMIVICGYFITIQSKPGTTPYDVFGTAELYVSYDGDPDGDFAVLEYAGLTNIAGTDSVNPTATQVAGIDGPRNAVYFANKPLILFSDSNGRATSSSIDSGGANFQVGDAVVGQTGSPVFQATVATVAGGAIATINVTNPGGGLFRGSQVIAPASGDAGIRAAVVNDGGLGYAPGDTVSVDAYTGSVLTVATVGALGVVTGLTLTTLGSSGAAGSAQATTALTGGGTGLLVDTTVLGSGATIDITAVQPLANGDGAVVITIPYIEVSVA